jgi:hypothetical protein
MSDMIERVAKAICEESGEAWRDIFGGYWRDLAHAAIEAMRDIPQGMVDAGNFALSSNGVDNVEDDDAALCWQAMIEFALSQDTHSLPTAPEAATNPPIESCKASAGQPAGVTPSVPAGTNSGDTP